MTCRLVILLVVVVTLSDLATHEGVAATATAKEPPGAAPSSPLQGNAGPASGETMVDAPRDPKPGSTTRRQEQPASPLSRQEHTRSKSSSGGAAGAAGGYDSSVDNVLAALVDYSKDPKLWRFVHSVVDELDYSLRASHPQASASPHRPQAALHITHPNTHWGRTSTGGKHVTGQSNSHTDTWNNDHKGYLTRSSSDKLLTTTTTTATPLLPWLQQPPEEPFIGGHTTQDYNISSDVSSQSRSSKVNFVKSVPPPSTHFFFHRVFLDKSFDNRTRQPYHRPVLALTARDIGAAKSSVDQKGNTSDAANHTAHESNHGSATKEFTDKFDSLPAAPKHSDESSQGKEVTQDEDERHGGDDNSENVILEKHYQHHHHHHRHKLHTFKSQLQYLQRWEERLWRRAHLQPRHHTSGGL
ncbi:uncharacterized protein LOC123516463 [Portunus trituberculatus]|uniref:uncharacterized protein LOC123516463 n=1 Tax=Portunus trituberculatus TaxID=210409 RepID=UPI001E1CB2B7|nr:uncharacterized protein LOC123516463 [Portunus trituberculatus]